VHFLLKTILILIILLLLEPFNYFYAIIASLPLYQIFGSLFKIIKNKDTSEIIIFITTLFTWIFFCSPFFFSELVQHEYRIIPEDYLFEIVFFSSISTIAIRLGYDFFSKKVISPISNPLMKFSNKQLYKLFFAFVFFGSLQIFIERYFKFLYNFAGEVFSIFEVFPNFALCIGFLYILRGGRSIFLKITFVGFALFNFLIVLATTQFGYLFFLFLIFGSVYFLEKKKIPYKSIFLIIILLAPLFFLRKSFRYEILTDSWYGNQKFSIKEKVELGFNFFFNSVNVESFNNMFENSAENQVILDRFEMISYIGQCIHVHEIQLREYDYGLTMWSLPISFVPRVIFPWKLKADLATTKTKEYGIKLGEKGQDNWPMLVEFYINFGFFGMIILSFVQGVIYSFTLKKVCHGIGDINLIIFVHLLWFFWRVEAQVLLIWGGIYQCLILWWVFSKFVKLK
jgi:hypothetical protein